MAIRCLVGKGHKQGFLRLLHSSSSSPSLSPVPIPTKPATKTQRSPVNFVSQGRLRRSSKHMCVGGSFSSIRPPYDDDDFMFRVHFALDSIGQIEKKKYELVGLLFARRWVGCAGRNMSITLEAKAGGKNKYYEATIIDNIALQCRLTLSHWNDCWPDAHIRKSYNKLQFKGLGEERQGGKGRIGAVKG